MPDADAITTLAQLSAAATRPLHPVWGYCRVSSEKQEDGQSFDVQRADIAAYCEKHQLPPPRFVVETGSAGKPLLAIALPGQQSAHESAPRPLLLTLLGYLTDERPDDPPRHLVVWKLDRLARIAAEQEFMLGLLSRKQVRVHSTYAGEDDLINISDADPMRKLIRTVIGGIGEYERVMITTRMRAGQQMKAAKGMWAGGGVPFGYFLNQAKDLQIYPEQVETVRQIFYWRDRCSHSFDAIARKLNGGMKTGEWYKNRVIRVVNNRQLYMGTYTDPYGAAHSRPDLRILPDDWGAEMEGDLLKPDLPEMV